MAPAYIIVMPFIAVLSRLLSTWTGGTKGSYACEGIPESVIARHCPGSASATENTYSSPGPQTTLPQRQHMLIIANLEAGTSLRDGMR